MSLFSNNSLFGFQIEGGKDLAKILKKLPIEMEKKAAKRAVLVGARVVQKEAKRLTKKKTGTLRRAIQVTMRSARTGDSMASVVVRMGKKYQKRKMDAWYAAIVEFGAPAYGRPATPFMRPALDAKSKEAILAMSQEIALQLKYFAAGAKNKTEYKRLTK